MAKQRFKETRLTKRSQAKQETQPTKEPTRAATGDESWWGEKIGNRFLMFQVMPSWLVSFLVHLLILLLFALLSWRLPQQAIVSLMGGEASVDMEELAELDFDAWEDQESFSESTEVVEVQEDALSLSDVLDDSPMELGDVSHFELDMEPWESAGDFGFDLNVEAGGILGGRSAINRMEVAKKYGGTVASEAAVALALQWLEKQQADNGGWALTGSSETSFAGTSLALLTFLGAGETHMHGRYQEVVEKGLAYLLGPNGGEWSDHGLSFYESSGNMYSHGLTSICLCEAYAMTEDSRLWEPASGTLQFIEYAQDPRGGGWRYSIQSAGDTSVVGWQIMAIKSAKLCGIKVADETISKATQFLDSVSAESGSYYGYTDAPPPEYFDATMTAVGLMCRIYLGWSQENPSLARGVFRLSEHGPSIGDWTAASTGPASGRGYIDMYYNYNATQVMRLYGGEMWTKWNETMRECLVGTQITEGANRGSWNGDLYQTTFSAMTLEVYYRYLSLYDLENVDDDEFELD